MLRAGGRMACTQQTASACAHSVTDRAAGILARGWQSWTTYRGGAFAGRTSRMKDILTIVLRRALTPRSTSANTATPSRHNMHAAWAPTAILRTLLFAATTSLAPQAMAEEVSPDPLEQPVQEPEQPTPALPDVELAQVPEPLPKLTPVELQWRILPTDPAVTDTPVFVRVRCTPAFGPSEATRYDFPWPALRGTVHLSGPSHCTAHAYYWTATGPTPEAGVYRYSEGTPALPVDPLMPAPELLPAGMETAALRCAASTQRCVTSRLQTAAKTRDGVRVRSCSCVLVE